MNAEPVRAWRYSPDATIERIWCAREQLEREAEGDVRTLFALAARLARDAMAGLPAPPAAEPAAPTHTDAP